MKWTEKQQKAISLRNKNILVSAAAGSGKTAVLVERIKGLLLEDRVELDRMLIVTFSNAAASEMKEKIVAALNAELMQSSENVEKQRFLRRQLNRIHRCNISTFHAFAMEVIRRYFHLIGAEPGFKICDEGQKTILQSEALETVFSELFERNDPDFLRFLDQYGTGKSENDVRDMILKLHGFIQSLPEPLDWLLERIKALNMTAEEFGKSAAFQQMCGEIASGLELCLFYLQETERLLEESGVASLLPKIGLDIQLVSEALNCISGVPGEEAPRLFTKIQYEAVSAYLNGEKGTFQRLVASKADKEAYEAVKEEAASLRNRGRDIFKKLGEQYAQKPLEEYVAEIRNTAGAAGELYRLVKEFDVAYAEGKGQKNLLDFNDIEHYALRILAHDEAAAEYREKFLYIFIDEYQDSNLVQETLIGRICRENNVFMVGDVKQSIYKFRLAEPELFLDKYERFRRAENEPEGLDSRIDLNQNFRSKGNTISAINEVFSRIMSRESTGMDYDEDAALYKGVAYEGELDYPMSLHLVDDRAADSEVDEEIQDMKKAELEAYAAARLICQSRGKLIYDGKKGVERPLQNRDIVILLRGAKGYADLYYKALSEEGIPAFMDNSDGYFDTVEIQVFLNLLQVIDNGKQDLPLLSALRSPVFDFSIDELAQVRLERSRGAYYEAFSRYGASGADEALREKCRDTAQRLTRWRRQAAYTPLSDFMAMLISETGYGDFIAAIPSGLQRQANLRALVDKAAEYESAQTKGLFGFIRYIDALKKEKISVGQVKLAGENDDVVRIMTVHKSKGLEFPFVLTGGLGRRFNMRQDTVKVSFHKELGVALRLVDPEGAYYKKTLLQTLIEQKKHREDMAEEIRTLYVAFTRAMDELILMGTVTDVDKAMGEYALKNKRDVLSARCYLDMVVPVLLETGTAIYRHDRSEYSAEKQVDAAAKEELRRVLERGFSVNMDLEENLRMRAEIVRRLSYVYPAAQEEKKSKYSVSELANPFRGEEEGRRFSMPQSLTPRFMEQTHTMTAAERGTAMHKVMEHIPFTETGKSPEDIAAFARSMVEREMMTAEEEASLDCGAIASFFRSDIGCRACRSPELYREESFNLKKVLDGEEVIVQGTIDCYFREADHYVLVDYKSGYVRQEHTQEAVETILEKYRPQTALYKEALETIRGIDVRNVYLYLFSLGREVRVE